jgi:hypothetical protein
LHLSLSYYDSQRVGIILSTIISDVRQSRLSPPWTPLSVVIDTLTVVGMLCVIFWLHWDFALIALAVLPFLVFFVARIRAPIQKATQEVRRRQADIVATMLLSCARNSMKISGESFEDVVGGLGPGERFGVLVPGVHPVADGFFQRVDRGPSPGLLEAVISWIPGSSILSS